MSTRQGKRVRRRAGGDQQHRHLTLEQRREPALARRRAENLVGAHRRAPGAVIGRRRAPWRMAGETPKRRCRCRRSRACGGGRCRSQEILIGREHSRRCFCAMLTGETARLPTVIARRIDAAKDGGLRSFAVWRGEARENACCKVPAMSTRPASHVAAGPMSHGQSFDIDK